MTIKATTLRPGFLVVVKASTSGNVRYSRTVIEEDHLTEEGARRARWETERTIADAAEHVTATKVRTKARSLVRSVCVQSGDFGLLCPESKIEQLAAAAAAGRKLADDFNATSRVSRVGFYFIAARIAADDVEAARAIGSEVRDLMRDMQDGLAAFDVEKVRDAASRAKDIGQMLSPAMQERVQEVVEVARKAAREIVKAGETAAREIDQATIVRIEGARTAFLDLDGGAEVQAPAPEAPAALDFTPEAPVVLPAAAAAPALELE